MIAMPRFALHRLAEIDSRLSQHIDVEPETQKLLSEAAGHYGLRQQNIESFGIKGVLFRLRGTGLFATLGYRFQNHYFVNVIADSDIETHPNEALFSVVIYRTESFDRVHESLKASEVNMLLRKISKWSTANAIGAAALEELSRDGQSGIGARIVDLIGEEHLQRD
jgi:hypothetical protein